MDQFSRQDASITALTNAWSLQQHWQQQAEQARHRFHQLQRGLIVLALGAALLTMVPALGITSPALAPLRRLSPMALVLCGTGFMLLYAIGNRLQDRRPWDHLATAAALLARHLAIYRTILAPAVDRPQWLNHQLQTTQQRLLESLGDGWLLPPPLAATAPLVEADTWLPEDYLQYRLLPHLQRTEEALARNLQQRQILRGFVLACGGGWLLLALLGSPWSLGVAGIVTLALGLGLSTGPRQQTIESASQIWLGLSLLYHHWQSLAVSDRTGQAFVQWVLATEAVIGGETVQVGQRVQQALADLGSSPPDLLSQVLAEPMAFFPGSPRRSPDAATAAGEDVSGAPEVEEMPGAIGADPAIQVTTPAEPANQNLPQQPIAMPPDSVRQ